MTELALHTGYGALQIADELQRLELIDARVASATAPAIEALEASSAWAAECWDESFRLLTMRLDGRLVAFVAGILDDDRVVISHVCLATWLRARHPEVASRVIDAFVASGNVGSGLAGHVPEAAILPISVSTAVFDAALARLLEEGS